MSVISFRYKNDALKIRTSQQRRLSVDLTVTLCLQLKKVAEKGIRKAHFCDIRTVPMGIYYFKDALKTFDDFKNKQKKCMK